jgi:type I restriction enzyme S subunit
MQRYETYKPSGAEWLGDIPGHWALLPAKRLFREISEKDHPNAELLSVTQEFGVVPRDQLEQRVVMPTGQLQTFKLVRADDFVISLRSFQGGIEYSAFTGLVSPAYTVLRKQKSINSRYLKHLLKCTPFISELNTSVTGIREGKNISFAEMAYSLLPIPEPSEQEDIADFLDRKTAEIDAAVAKKNRLIELLQEQKHIRINQAVLRGLNPDVPMRDSGVPWIGAIPEHWKVIPNRYIFREQNERSLHGKETHLSMSQRLGLVPAKELDVQTLQSESYDGAKLCQKGDLVQNRLKAHLAVFAVSPCDGLVSPDYSVFRLNDPKYQPVFFERLFKTPNYLGEFNRRVRGIVVGFLRLYSGDFNAIPALVPPEEEQREIVTFIEKINVEFSRVQMKIENEIDQLQELRAITVASAVTGKIKV